MKVLLILLVAVATLHVVSAKKCKDSKNKVCKTAVEGQCNAKQKKKCKLTCGICSETTDECVDKRKKWCAKVKTCNDKAKKVCRKKCGTCDGDEGKDDKDDNDNDNNDNDNNDNNDNNDKADPFRDAALKFHNKYREMHSAEPLVWDSEVAKFSEEWCKYLRDNDKFEHSSKNGYGENLYKSFGSGSGGTPAIIGERATTSWYNEVEQYNFDEPGFKAGTGHFTQVVWKNTRNLGCAMAETTDGGKFATWVCCNYTPPGNFLGQFRENVLPAKGI